MNIFGKSQNVIIAINNFRNSEEVGMKIEVKINQFLEIKVSENESFLEVVFVSIFIDFWSPKASPAAPPKE